MSSPTLAIRGIFNWNLKGSPKGKNLKGFHYQFQKEVEEKKMAVLALSK